jgi:tRNA (guanine-N7-)-methyltransferase
MKKDPALKFSYREDFKYTTDNPYSDKLNAYADFVMQDNNCEELRGKWAMQEFKNNLPLHVEIGSGFGDFMFNFCNEITNVNFIGMDYRFKRSYQVARKLAKIPHRNFRYLRAMGERIGFMFDAAEVERLYYFFPDPWPKARHNKKRLFQKPFLDAAHKVLSPQGEIWIKTDHDDYFAWMLEHLEQENRFSIELQSFDLHADFPEHFLSTHKTKFEHIFLGQGIKIKALILRKK